MVSRCKKFEKETVCFDDGDLVTVNRKTDVQDAFESNENNEKCRVLSFLPITSLHLIFNHPVFGICIFHISIYLPHMFNTKSIR